MNDITIHSAASADFSGSGLGLLRPLDMTVSWVLNGMYQLDATFALSDPMAATLEIGAVIVAPVPAQETPSLTVRTEGETTSRSIYRVKTNGGNLHMRSGPGMSYKIISKYKNGTEVVRLEGGDGSWYRVAAPDGLSGYMSAQWLQFVRTETVQTGQSTTTVVDPKPVRRQPFRINRMDPGTLTVTVHARHIFFDLADNLLLPKTYANVTRQSAAQAFLEWCLDREHGFSAYCEGTESTTLEMTEPMYVTDAIMGGDGLIDRLGGELMADWYDVYIVDRLGRDRGVRVAYGRNLTSVSGSIDGDGMASHIVPIGTDANGEDLYLPEISIAAEDLSGFAHPRYATVRVDEARVGDGMTQAQAFEKMRSTARGLLAGGAVLPEASIRVGFVEKSRLVSASDARKLQRLFPGDGVDVEIGPMGIAARMRLAEYVYDCLLMRYRSVTLGTVSCDIATTGIDPRQLPSGGITSSKLANAAVTAKQLGNGAVQSAKIAEAAIGIAHINQVAVEQLTANSLTAVAARIQELVAGKITTDALTAGAVTAEKIAAGAVSADKIAAGAITADKIAAGAITADKIAAGAITADKIAAGAVSAQSVEAVTAALGELTAGEIETDRLYAALAHVIGLAAVSISAGQLEADQLAAALARVVTLQAGTGEFDFATVQNLVAGAMSLETGCAGTVAINNLLVSSANLLNAVIGGLVLKSANGKYYTVTVGSDGALGAEEVAVSGGEIAAGVASDGRSIVETSANIENLAAGTILGQRAVLNSILTTALTAGSITASEALLASASVPALYTTAIRAIGNSLDLSANESIRMVVDSLSTEKSTVFRQEEQPAGAGNGDLWIQPSTGRTWQYSCGEESALRFALTDDGQLAYGYADGETAYPIVIDENGMLAIDADARLLVDPDDVSGVWLLVSDPADPAQALDTYSGVYINRDEIHLVSEKTTVAVPGANGEDDVARFDAEGVHAQIVEADTINSPSVVATQVAATYTPANAGELAAIGENLKNVCLTGNVTVNASALTGGTLTLRGVSGGYSLTISGGTVNSAEMIGCTARIVFSGVTFATSGAAATVEASPNVLIAGGALNAGTGVLATERSRVCVSSCGGVCDYAADSRGFAEVTFTGTAPGTDMPYGLAKFSDGGQIYAGARLISKPSAEPEPEKPTVQTVTLTPTLTRTYNGSWRDGYWLWQGRYGTLGLNRGCMWFDTSAFAGKTVLSASLSLKRLSGAGSGVAVAIKICGTTATGASGTPAVGAQYASVSIAQGARKSVDVTSAVQALANGSIRGLMLYDSSTSNLSSSNNWTACYAKLYGYDSGDRPVLTVTYQ